MTTSRNTCPDLICMRHVVMFLQVGYIAWLVFGGVGDRKLPRDDVATGQVMILATLSVGALQRSK